MNKLFPEKIQEGLAEKYLDLAERLPRFERGTISMLQTIRKLQRRDANATYERTRPPKELDYTYLFFRLFDIYLLENIDELLEIINGSFPAADSEFRLSGIKDEIAYQANNLSGLGWWRIGTIIRDPKGRLFGGVKRTLESLPQEVDYVNVGLYKILPSIFVLSLDVYVTSYATKEINKLQESKYLSKIRFKQLIPHGKYSIPHSTTMADNVMAEEINFYLANLRDKTRVALSFLLKGIFSNDLDEKRIPYIDVFVFKGVPQNNKLKKWINSHLSWWRTLGFNFFDYALYSDNKQLFTLSEHRKGELKFPHRLIILKEPFLENENLEMYNDDEIACIRHSTKYLLDSIQHPIAILEYLRFSYNRIGELRKHVFVDLKKSRMPPLSMRKFFKLNTDVLREVTVISRLSLEFDEIIDHFKHKLKELHDFQLLKSSDETADALDESLIKAIKYRITTIEKHMKFAEHSFSRHVELKNTVAIFRLTWIAVLLTIVSLIGLNNIKGVVNFFQKYLNELLLK